MAITIDKMALLVPTDYGTMGDDPVIIEPVIKSYGTTFSVRRKFSSTDNVNIEVWSDTGVNSVLSFVPSNNTRATPITNLNDMEYDVEYKLATPFMAESLIVGDTTKYPSTNFFVKVHRCYPTTSHFIEVYSYFNSGTRNYSNSEYQAALSPVRLVADYGTGTASWDYLGFRVMSDSIVSENPDLYTPGYLIPEDSQNKYILNCTTGTFTLDGGIVNTDGTVSEYNISMGNSAVPESPSCKYAFDTVEELLACTITQDDLGTLEYLDEWECVLPQIDNFVAYGLVPGITVSVRDTNIMWSTMFYGSGSDIWTTAGYSFSGSAGREPLSWDEWIPFEYVVDNYTTPSAVSLHDEQTAIPKNLGYTMSLKISVEFMQTHNADGEPVAKFRNYKLHSYNYKYITL